MNTFYDSVDDIKKMLFGESDNNLGGLNRRIEHAIHNGNIDFPPLYLMMKVTNLCNSNCLYCNHAANKNHTEVKDSISYEVLADIIEQAKELGIRAISFSGGEPLVRDDIELLIKRTAELGIVPVLLTNGLLLEERAESLYHAGLRYFIVSIDSLEKEAYKQQRGVSLEKVIKGVEKLKTLKQSDDSIKIHITPVVTRNNIKQMPSFVKQLSNDGIAVQFSPYHHFDYNAEDNLSVDDFAALRDAIDQIIDLKNDGCLVANSEQFLRHFIDFFESKKMIPDHYRCLSGFASIYVDAYKNVLPCWSGCFGPIGNLGRETLRNIWYGKKYADFRKKMYNCECSGCWFLCTGELTLMLNEGAY